LHPTNPKTLEDQTAITPAQRQKAFGQADRYRYYGQDFAQPAARQGFLVTPVPYADNFSPEEQTRLSLGQNEIIFVASPHGQANV
ncbi:MAG: hypothetical protein ACO1OQ_01645, partial [Rufibacter sp.]